MILKKTFSSLFISRFRWCSISGFGLGRRCVSFFVDVEDIRKELYSMDIDFKIPRLSSKVVEDRLRYLSCLSLYDVDEEGDKIENYLNTKAVRQKDFFDNAELINKLGGFRSFDVLNEVNNKIIIASLSKPSRKNKDKNGNNGCFNITGKILGCSMDYKSDLLDLDKALEVYMKIEKILNDSYPNNRVVNSMDKKILYICVVDRIFKDEIDREGFRSFLPSADAPYFVRTHEGEPVRNPEYKFIVTFVAYWKFFGDGFFKDYIAFNKDIPYNTVFIFTYKSWQNILQLFKEQGFEISGGSPSLRHLYSKNENVISKFLSLYPTSMSAKMTEESFKKDSKEEVESKGLSLKSNSNIIKDIQSLHNLNRIKEDSVISPGNFGGDINYSKVDNFIIKYTKIVVVLLNRIKTLMNDDEYVEGVNTELDNIYKIYKFQNENYNSSPAGIKFESLPEERKKKIDKVRRLVIINIIFCSINAVFYNLSVNTNKDIDITVNDRSIFGTDLEFNMRRNRKFDFLSYFNKKNK